MSFWPCRLLHNILTMPHLGMAMSPNLRRSLASFVRCTSSPACMMLLVLPLPLPPYIQWTRPFGTIYSIDGAYGLSHVVAAHSCHESEAVEVSVHG